jgi:FkbM family methyltransferase
MDRERLLVCVEAHPGLISVAKRNLQLNVLNANTRLLNAAICYDSVRDGQVALVTTNNTLGTTVSTDFDSELLVRAVTLSEIISENSIASFAMVADIEGAEAGLVECDDKAFEKCQQVIIELHETTYNGLRRTVTDMKEMIVTKLGFTLTAQRGPVCVFDKGTPS